MGIDLDILGNGYNLCEMAEIYVGQLKYLLFGIGMFQIT